MSSYLLGWIPDIKAAFVGNNKYQEIDFCGNCDFVLSARMYDNNKTTTFILPSVLSTEYHRTKHCTARAGGVLTWPEWRLEMITGGIIISI